MIRRPLLVAVAFAASALIVFAALARITVMTLALERSETAALQRATHEENVRIALWRLDATLTDLLALENTRPAARFGLADEAVGLGLPLVRARFEVGPDRKLRSAPSLPAPRWVAMLPIPEQLPEQPPPAPVVHGAPVPANAPVQIAQAGEERQEQQQPQQATEPDAVNAAPATKAGDPWTVLQSSPDVLVDRINVGGNEKGQQSVYTQETLNTIAFQRRQELGSQAKLAKPAAAPPGVEVESAFEARWLDGDLVLLRRVRQGNTRLLQGTWLDWPALRSFLLERIAPVVPASDLRPVGAHDAADPARQLALLPARLVPGPMPETEPQDWTPVRLSLAAAWVAALLGLVGVGGVLKGTVALSQRRADFVSAVTHELRTPLTTLRLYTGLLREGSLSDEERPSFLATLENEADRLAHLVDNVLVFSRLEGGRLDASPLESVRVADLLERAVPHLTQRAAQAGLALAVEVPPEVGGRRALVHAAGVEQILANLVDNACKYAASAAEPTLRLGAEERKRRFVLTLSDHGPGIAARERRRIFRAFHRSGAAGDRAPGVGLGLALSRRLARRMGGDLRLARSDGGACFELLLRGDDAAAP